MHRFLPATIYPSSVYPFYIVRYYINYPHVIPPGSGMHGFLCGAPDRTKDQVDEVLPATTVCPGSSDAFYIVRYYIKWVTTSWTYSSLRDAD